MVSQSSDNQRCKYLLYVSRSRGGVGFLFYEKLKNLNKKIARESEDFDFYPDLVPWGRLEPPRNFLHMPLKHACLPFQHQGENYF